MDKKRLLERLDLLESYFHELEEHIPTDKEEYSTDLEKRRFCERTLQLLIEVCIDTSRQLTKELKLGLPEEKESIFDKLHQKKILSKTMTNKLKDMKKFRNVLIHHYVKIDDELVYEKIKKNRKDFLLFKKEILAYLKK